MKIKNYIIIISTTIIVVYLFVFRFSDELLGAVIGVAGVFVITKWQANKDTKNKEEEIDLLKKQHEQMYYSSIRPFLLIRKDNTYNSLSIENLGNGVATNIEFFIREDEKMISIQLSEIISGHKRNYFTIGAGDFILFNLSEFNKHKKYEVLYTDINNNKISTISIEIKSNGMSTSRKIEETEYYEAHNIYTGYIRYINTH